MKVETVKVWMQAFFDEHLGMVVNVVSPVLAEQADKISQKNSVKNI